MRHENFETLFNGFHFIASHEKRIIAVKITPFVPSVSMLALVIWLMIEMDIDLGTGVSRGDASNTRGPKFTVNHR